MTTLRIAIQKSGRLNEDSLKIIKDCGISIDNGKDQLKASARNFPLEVFYLRNGDIPQYLRDGVVDIAIIGENVLIEKGEEILFTQRLGFSKCKVSLAISKNETYTGIDYFTNKRIATSYPNTVRKYVIDKGIETEIHVINGSVEIAPNIGLADGICDIVSSGSTLFKNNLKEVRQKNGFTQEELGTNVGVSRQTIISIERYRYKPSLELAMKIANELNVKIEKLFYFV